MPKEAIAGIPVVASDGRWVELDYSIARGGEGSIHPVVGAPHLLAKIVNAHKRRDAPRIARLRWMVDRPPLAGDGWTTAWPVDLLLDANDIIVGFLMQNFAGATSLVVAARQTTPEAPRQWTRQARYRVGANLARAVAELHERGHVLCDISPDNVLIQDDDSVVLIDLDSFSILADPGPPPVRHESASWRAVYSAPEVFAVHGHLPRETHQDTFSLALTLYHWLAGGAHPFSGRPRSGSVAPNVTDAMRDGWFVHDPRPDRPLDPGPASTAWNDFPATLRTLFHRCFVTAHTNHPLRPSAREWEAALAIAAR